METYNFKAANWVILVLTFIFSIIGGLFLIIFFLPKGSNAFHFILSFVALLFFIIYILRQTSFAKVEITLDNETISIKWLEQFLFHKKQNVIISFDEIATYVNQSDLNWDWLKIEMIDGKIHKIWYSKFFSTNDDYFNFVSAFISKVKNHNNTVLKKAASEGSDVKLKSIKRAKSIYETTGGLIMAGFSIVAIIGVPILFIFIPHKNPTNYGLLGMGYIGAIYFLHQFYVQRKKRKTDD